MKMNGLGSKTLNSLMIFREKSLKVKFEVRAEVCMTFFWLTRRGNRAVSFESSVQLEATILHRGVCLCSFSWTQALIFSRCLRGYHFLLTLTYMAAVSTNLCGTLVISSAWGKFPTGGAGETSFSLAGGSQELLWKVQQPRLPTQLWSLNSLPPAPTWSCEGAKCTADTILAGDFKLDS